MKFAAIALLLFVEGAYAMPKSDADVAQERIVDYILRDAILRYIARIQDRGLDPLKVESREFNYIITPGWIQLSGLIEDLEIIGLSNIKIYDLRYNIIFGSLVFDIGVPEFSVSIGKAEALAVFQGTIIEGDLSGSLVLNDIRLKGNALLLLSADWVQVYNIDVDFRVEKIASDLTVIGSEDHSDRVNEFINVRIPNFFATFRTEINTIIGEIIRYAVSYWNTNRPRSLEVE